MAPGPNLPLVIQQAPDVSRLQEGVQRTGEVQQAAAETQAAETRELQRSQVQAGEPSDAQNRIRNEEQEQRERRRREREAARRRGEKGESKEQEASDGGLLVDVVV